MIFIKTYFLDIDKYLYLISFISIILSFFYFDKLEEKEQRLKFLNILCNVMGFLFLIVLITSLFNVTQQNYSCNIEIMFILTIMGYILTIIFYNISDKNKNNIMKIFMYLLKITLFISSAIMVFAFIIFKNTTWININSIWVLGLFLLSCWKLIDINDFKQ